MSKVTTRELAEALDIEPQNKRYSFPGHDDHDCTVSAGALLVLAALGRGDITPSLNAHVHMVAYAVRKSIVTGRMDPAVANRVRGMTPYQVCEVVALVAAECGDAATVGGICDMWLPRHQHDLIPA